VSFRNFSIDSTLACLHAGEKYCPRRTALNTFVRKVIARSGRSLKVRMGKPFGPEALITFSPLMVCSTSEELATFGSLAGHTRQHAPPH
jgi:hypothetical protein